MRRLALLAAAILAVAAPRAARAEPLDVDLSRLGPPDAQVWTAVYARLPGNPPLAQATADQYASESRQRFAVLSSQMALALSSAVLQPASTTGHSGFAVDLEVAAMQAHSDPVGVATAGFTNQVWATGATQPSMLYVPSIHVRKALPWSLELGGRLIYLASSNAYAAQGEGKWAVSEGFESFPDVAFRAAYTHLYGVKDWNLSTTDLDLLVSKRWGIMGVSSLTPYGAFRFTRVSASSDRIDFAPSPTLPTTPAELATQASFPSFSAWLYRTTIGLRFTAYAVALALEATYFGGASSSAKGYEGLKLPSALGGAAKLGWEW